MKCRMVATAVLALILVAAMPAFAQKGGNVTLTLSVQGGGTTVPAPGVHSYAKNTNVTITAYADQGWNFVRWEGSVTGSQNPVTVRMSSNKTVVAVFETATYTLTTNVQGSGTVDPAGTTSYAPGTPVTVTATAGADYIFSHWEGSLSGNTNPDVVVMDGNKTVTAVFVEDPNAPGNALRAYVDKPDANYSWSQYHSAIGFPYTTYFLNMRSQQWRTAAEVDYPMWDHHVVIHDPWFTQTTCILVVSGGSRYSTPPTTPDSDIGLLAAISGVTVAEVKQVPNQPLFFTDEVARERTEDEILAYSLDKYLVTGDAEWPVHLAMVKSVVRAMDTIQARLPEVTKFIIAGGSKRGWTTWLTAAYNDPRIIGFAPMVIDILNFDENVRHHWEAYGFWAPAIVDYVEFDLFCRMDDPAGQDLMRIVDPFEYLDSPAYSKPKFLVNSTGDQFFLPDSSQYYLDYLPGLTHLRYVPNTDHSLEQNSAVINGIAEWATTVKNNGTNKRYSWTFEPDGSIRVQCIDLPQQVLLWQATNPTARDFRLEAVGPIYTSSVLSDQGGGVYVGNVTPPAQGWTAYFVELNYGSDVFYTSEIRIVPEILPFQGTACQP